MKEIILNVKGMVCEGCENRVQNAVKSISGVKKVKANHMDGTVTVTAKEEINETTIKEKIETIGFQTV